MVKLKKKKKNSCLKVSDKFKVDENIFLSGLINGSHISYFYY